MEVALKNVIYVIMVRSSKILLFKKQRDVQKKTFSISYERQY